MTKNEAFRRICGTISALHEKKNADYGDSFSKSWDDYGMLSALVRMGDKMNRIKQLALSGNRNVNDESIRDTLLDLASYAIMTVIELDERKIPVQ